MHQKIYAVYIMTNKHHTALYTGMTGDLETRIRQHRAGVGSKFTSKYKTTKLVYIENYTHVWDAIAREKAIKGGSRIKKIALIQSQNPEWNDLFIDASLPPKEIASSQPRSSQ